MSRIPKLKIYFFTHYVSMNGANTSLYFLLLYLKEKAEIKVFISGRGNEKSGLHKELEKVGIPNEIVRLQPFLYYSGIKSLLAIPLKILMNLPTWFSLYSELKKQKVDWIYSNSSVENTGLLMSKLLRKKHLWHIREFGFKDYGYHHLGGDKGKRAIFNKSNQLVAISNSIANYIDLPEITEIVHNGIFFEHEISGLKTKNDLPSYVHLGMVGIIGPMKNQKRALKLIDNVLRSGFRNLHLHFYGGVANNEYLKEIKDMIAVNELSGHVTLHGFVDDQTDIYEQIDILLMCSPSEAFGRVTVEAMAYGIPVLGYDNAGTSELIKNGYNGLLYNDESLALENVFDMLVQGDSNYKNLSENAKQSAYKYTVERYGGRILNLLNTIYDE